ncbi:MAG: N-6 DNA methylase [Eubacteriaceae bacterium]|nr:N-6 DNA methylase [Eubacteriaceae bacterium]
MDINDASPSESTIRNWERLGKGEPGSAFASRANKRMSKKTVVPIEYASDPMSISILQEAAAAAASSEDTAGYIFSLCCSLLIREGLLGLNGAKPYALDAKGESLLSLFEGRFDQRALSEQIPCCEADPIGLCYQLAQSEGTKNKHGSYFTPPAIALSLSSGIDSESILDPCCGTGSLLFSVEGALAECLYGCDIDEACVAIARTNWIRRFPNAEGAPNIIKADFLSSPFAGKRFGAIIANPPWGAAKSKKAGGFSDTFADFLCHSINAAKHQASIRFVLPEAFLNVSSHQQIRAFVLEKAKIEKIELYGKAFSGVFTEAIGLFLRKEKAVQSYVAIARGGSCHELPQSRYDNSDNSFYTCTERDLKLIDLVYSVPHQTLKNSDWALGIVTGDNKGKLAREPVAGFEPIYVGRDIDKYKLKQPSHWIDYKNGRFQQQAKEQLYRQSPKLAYRFISKSLVFALDEGSSLFLNSANIVVPKLEGISMHSALAFLNSELFAFICKCISPQIKVLKSSLLKLPFPYLSSSDDLFLKELCFGVINGELFAHNKVQEFIFSCFGIGKNDRIYIQNALKE